MAKKILTNSITCLVCGEVLFSEFTHDFNYCFCGKVAIDGGKEYLKRVGDKRNFKENSTFDDDVKSFDSETIYE